MEKISSFRQLNAWKKAHQLVLDVYRQTQGFPREELFGLTSQMRRAAVSVSANVAEGFKRRGLQDKIRFYNISEGSLEELKYYFILSRDLEYIDNETYGKFMLQADDVGRLLYRSHRQHRTASLVPPYSILHTPFYRRYPHDSNPKQ